MISFDSYRDIKVWVVAAGIPHSARYSALIVFFYLISCFVLFKKRKDRCSDSLYVLRLTPVGRGAGGPSRSAGLSSWKPNKNLMSQQALQLSRQKVSGLKVKLYCGTL